MTGHGIVVFSRAFNQNFDVQLFGGLMSALNSFAEQLSEGGLSNFELSDKRFAIMKTNEFLFVANASLSVKDKKLREEIIKIAEKFFAKYPDITDGTWDHDVSRFGNFEEEIKDALKNPMEKFWDGF